MELSLRILWKNSDKNKPLMTKLREENSKHEIEKVGKGLRSMFSWLK